MESRQELLPGKECWVGVQQVRVEQLQDLESLMGG